MNDVTSSTITDRDKWNENFLAATLLEKPDFFTRNGTKRPLTTLLYSMYPQYSSKKAYLKNLFVSDKLEIDKLKLSLEEISEVIDDLNLLTDDEEAYYEDKSYFFKNHFGSIYNLPIKVEKEYNERLYQLRLFAFLRGDIVTKDLEINFAQIKSQSNMHKVFNSKFDILGIGLTLFLMSNLNLETNFYNNEVATIGGYVFSFTGALYHISKIYSSKLDISYAYLGEKCIRADKLIENLIPE